MLKMQNNFYFLRSGFSFVIFVAQIIIESNSMQQLLSALKEHLHWFIQKINMQNTE